MLEQILPYIKSIKLINYDPEDVTSFTNQFVRDWILKGTNRIDAVFCEGSIFFKTTIPTNAIMKRCLMIDCQIKSMLKKPYVSLTKGSIMLNSFGNFKKIDNSLLESSEIIVNGSGFGSTFKNCVIHGGSFTDCILENCIINNATLIMCDTDSSCTLNKTKEVGKKRGNMLGYTVKKSNFFNSKRKE
jgi:uncharacterized protein YjbI with pentapeptide repeats